MRHAAYMTLVLLLAAAGCGGSSTAPSNNNNTSGNTPPPQNQPSTSDAITVSNDFFDPSSTTVPVGTKVTWTWNACGSDGYGGQTCVSHNIVFDDGPSSGSQTQGTWARAFAVAGTYKYHCAIHGSSMSGTIMVQ